MFKPRLRNIEPIPVREGEETLIVLRDPEELYGEPLAVALPMFMVMAHFTGRHDLREIQVEVTREFNQLVSIEQIEQVITEIDNFYLLDNERSRIRREDLERDFLRMPTRPAAHAGAAYPSDPVELAEFLDEFFEQATAAGAKPRTKHPRGLITPHIDLRMGGACMAWGFNELKVSEPPELYIILGVAHHYTPNMFTLCEKDFETPLGTAPVHRGPVERLKELYGANRLAGEYAHKREHSVEFQTVFLKHLHRDGAPFGIVPILCSSLHESYTEPDCEPVRDREDVRDFCAAIKTIIEEFGPRVCVIAGVDLSHVGKKFGEMKGVDDFRAELVRSADLRMLDHVVQRDPAAFFNHFREDANARNVDAVCSVYTLLHVLGSGEPGRMLNYDQYREHQTESMVTYASMALD